MKLSLRRRTAPPAAPAGMCRHCGQEMTLAVSVVPAGQEVTVVPAEQEVTLIAPDDAPSLLRRGPKILRQGDPLPMGHPQFYDEHNRLFRWDSYCQYYHHYNDRGDVIASVPDLLTALHTLGPLTLA